MSTEDFASEKPNRDALPPKSFSLRVPGGIPSFAYSRDRPHPIFQGYHDDHIPPSDEVLGFFFKPLNGNLALLRFIDFKWVMNRWVQLGRDSCIAGPLFYYILWRFWWCLPQQALWGDGNPPRQVTWNNEKAGYLPADFVPTAAA